MWSLISQGRSLSFTGWPGELFAAESRKSAFQKRRTVGSPSPGGGSCHRRKGWRREAGCHSTRRGSLACSSGRRSRCQSATESDCGRKFLSNELRTVVGIDESKIVFDKGEIIRNGASLHLDQGTPVTSHASQAKTVDRSLSACRFGRSARRTRHNFMARCRVRGGLCMSLLIVR
jgi:hypothetical protein